MMRAECVYKSPVSGQQFSNGIKQEPADVERQNDSGISPGRSSETNSNSPNFSSNSPPNQLDNNSPTNLIQHSTPKSKSNLQTPLSQHGVYFPPNYGPPYVPEIYPRSVQDLTYPYSYPYRNYPNYYPQIYPNSPESKGAIQEDNITRENSQMFSPKSKEENSEKSNDCEDDKREDSQNGEIKCNGEAPEDSLERLKIALESSTALSGIFKSSKGDEDSENSQENDKKEFSCPLCAYTTPYRHRYVEHINTHYSDKCTLCDFKGQDLRIHLQEIHNITELQDLNDAQEISDPEDDDSSANNKRSKSKTFKCKQCNYVTNTKLDFWEHSKEHIKVEKLLTCPKCPFVTEYKHHLEYHLRNHFGSKPFKCSKCPYSCVNKSMLNSHLKSHSNIYQYRCSDCAYATKYCHSLKLHLRKYQHKPSVVLNADGSPNPLPIIDVYGTRRGPKQKPKDEIKSALNIKIPNKEKHFNISPRQSPISSPLAEGIYKEIPWKENEKEGSDYIPTYENNNKILQDDFKEKPKYYCHICDFQTISQDVLGHHVFLHAAETNLVNFLQTNNNLTDTNLMKDYFNNVLTQKPENGVSPYINDTRSGSPSSLVSPRIHSPVLKTPISPLDLSKPDIDTPLEVKKRKTPEPIDSDKKESKNSTTKHRRKGKAYKLERINDIYVIKTDEKTKEEPDKYVQIKVPEYRAKLQNDKEVTHNSEGSESPAEDKKMEVSNDTYTCAYCDIAFKDIVMYTMHMGYHGYQDPFTCNMCGHVTPDKVAFFLHIARSSHS